MEFDQSHIEDVSTRSSSGRALFVRWIVIGIVLAALTGSTLVVFHFILPTETEREIQLDLASSKLIDSSAKVWVLSDVTLVSFHEKKYPHIFATVCIRENSGFHLAHVHLWRSGTRWRSDHTKWKPFQKWPNSEQIRDFDKKHSDRFARQMSYGNLPRPPGMEDFRVTHLSIEVSKKVDGYDPNQDVDPVLFATILRNEFGNGLNRFTFATFHKPRWFRAADGVVATEELIGAMRKLGDQPEVAHLDVEQFIRQLAHVKNRLSRAEELELKFYFLARETTH